MGLIQSHFCVIFTFNFLYFVRKSRKTYSNCARKAFVLPPLQTLNMNYNAFPFLTGLVSLKPGGGFIIMKAQSEDDVFDYFDNDPMRILGLQNYMVNEFNIYKQLPFACDWFTA